MKFLEYFWEHLSTFLRKLLQIICEKSAKKAVSIFATGKVLGSLLTLANETAFEAPQPAPILPHEIIERREHEKRQQIGAVLAMFSGFRHAEKAEGGDSVDLFAMRRARWIQHGLVGGTPEVYRKLESWILMTAHALEQLWLSTGLEHKGVGQDVRLTKLCKTMEYRLERIRQFDDHATEIGNAVWAPPLGAVLCIGVLTETACRLDRRFTVLRHSGRCYSNSSLG